MIHSHTHTQTLVCNMKVTSDQRLTFIVYYVVRFCIFFFSILLSSLDCTQPPRLVLVLPFPSQYLRIFRYLNAKSIIASCIVDWWIVRATKRTHCIVSTFARSPPLTERFASQYGKDQSNAIRQIEVHRRMSNEVEKLLPGDERYQTTGLSSALFQGLTVIRHMCMACRMRHQQ